MSEFIGMNPKNRYLKKILLMLKITNEIKITNLVTFILIF